MDPIDRGLDPEVDGIRRVVPRQRGLAMFGVLILVVIFTLLGVGGMSLARRENQNTGSILDIKSRQSAAYAGLVFALGEFQRDPTNFVALLEAWRKRTVYASAASPVKLYLQFSSAGAVALSTSQPAAFAIPNTSYKVVVELTGIQVPSTGSGDPVIVLRSTGTGRSGDQQTIVGTYRVSNVRMNQVSASLGIKHPFYVNGKGIWNNTIKASGGDVFFGNTTHLNSTAQEIVIPDGGIRVNGDLTWDNLKNLDVGGNSWVSGNMNINSSALGNIFNFKKNLVVGGKIAYTGTAKVSVSGSLVVQGAGGITIPGGRLYVGTANAGSELQVPNGPIVDATGGSTVNVVGSAYLKQLTDGAKAWTLNATTRLELADNAAVSQKFVGSGTWGHLVVRNAAAGSFLKPLLANGISIQQNSWLENASSVTLDSAGNTFALTAGKKIFYNQPTVAVCAGCPGIPGASVIGNTVTSQSLPAATDSISGIAFSGSGVNVAGFDATNPPKTLAQLGYSAISPTTENEMGFDISGDPTIESRAFLPGATGGLCFDNNKICGAYLNQAYSSASNASCFYNGFFVVKIVDFKEFTWDKSNTQTTPLVGKFLFIVSGKTFAANPWPTTAVNADLNNPTNVQFIYVKSTGSIFSSFCPRYLNNTTTPVVFCGYVRVDATGSSAAWDLTTAPVNFQGAVHFLGDRTTTSMTVNSGTGGAEFNLNQGVLNVLGAAFASSFKDPITGASLGGAVASGFNATENWIQFRPLSELR